MCSTSVTVRTLPVVSVFLPPPILWTLAGVPPGYWQSCQVWSAAESMPDCCGVGNQTQGFVRVTRALYKLSLIPALRIPLKALTPKVLYPWHPTA